MKSTLWSVKEVSAFLGKCEKWVYENQKIIPGYFRIGKAIFFDSEILKATLSEWAFKPVNGYVGDSSSGDDDPHNLTC